MRAFSENTKTQFFFANILLMLSLATACAQTFHLNQLEIKSLASEHDDDAEEYRQIWMQDGSRIIEVLETVTQLTFDSEPIVVEVFEGASFSGYKDSPMRLRASYTLDTKRATLVHELSHRLISELVLRGDDDHTLIFLFLYDVWLELWGQDFAKSQVVIESGRRGLYDYERAWKAALSLSVEERVNRWHDFRVRAQNRKRQ